MALKTFLRFLVRIFQYRYLREKQKMVNVENHHYGFDIFVLF